VVDDNLLVLKIYVEAISLLKTMFELKKNLQMLKFLGFHHGNDRCRNGLVR
jgi:hypothetical protein